MALTSKSIKVVNSNNTNNNNNNTSTNGLNSVLLVPLSRFHASQIKQVFVRSQLSPNFKCYDKIIKRCEDMESAFQFIMNKALADEMSYVALDWKTNTVAAACIGLRAEEENPTQTNGTTSTGTAGLKGSGPGSGPGSGSNTPDENQNQLNANSTTSSTFGAVRKPSRTRSGSFLQKLLAPRKRSSNQTPQQPTTLIIAVMISENPCGHRSVQQKLLQHVTDAARKRTNGNFAVHVTGAAAPALEAKKCLQKKLAVKRPFARLTLEEEFRQRIQTM